MKRTRLFSLIALVLVLAMSLSLFACNKHKHTFSEDWSSDAEFHWHAATCEHSDQISDKGAHADDDGNKLCDVCGYVLSTDDPTPPAPATVTPINTLLSETANNTDVVVEGVVFAVTSEGYFINDGTGSIFVLTQAAQAVGTKVKINANFRLRDGQPIVRGYEVLETVAGQTPITAVEATIASIVVLDKEARDSYGKFLHIEAIVAKDAVGRYVLSDGERQIIVSEESNDEALASFIGKKIYLDVITDASSSEGWFVSSVTAESDITLVPVVIEDVKAEIFAQVTEELKTTVYTSLELPLSNKSHPSVEFNWTVKSGTAIAITDNVATVTAVAAEEEVVLTLTISSYEQSAQQDFTVVVKVITAVELDQVALIEDAEKVISTQGQVVAVYENNLVIHKNGNYIKVNAEGEYKVGDEVTVVGTYGVISYGFKGITAEDVTVGSHTDVDFSTLTHIVVETDADYENLVKDYANQQVYFVKFVNPHINYSGNTSYSWIRFSGDTSRASGYSVTVDGNSYKRIFSLPLASLTGQFAGLEAELEVPFLAEGAQQRPGYTFYGFLFNAGSETWQIILAEENGVVLDKAAATDYEIKASFASTDIDATADGNVALLRSGKYVEEITWTANVDGVIDLATGNFSALEFDKTVVLTASYVIDGTTYTTDVTLKLLAGGIEFKSISDVIAAGSGTYNVEAYVAANATSSESSAAKLYAGLILTDGVNTLYYIQGTSAEYTYNEGDLVQILGLEVTIEAGHIQSAVGGEFTVVSTGNTIDYSNINAIEISSEAQLVEYAKNSKPDKGLILKFTGHFGFIGTGTLSDTSMARIQLTYREGVTGSEGARYAFADYSAVNKGNRTFAINLVASVPMMGEQWWTSFGIPENCGPGKLYYVTGTIYAVVGYNGNTLQSITIINPSAFDVKADKEHQADYEVRQATPTDLVRGGKLPTSTTNVESIAWECSVGSITINADGSYTGFTEDTPATLTAIYTVDGVECTTTIEVVFVYELPTITLAQALQARGELVKFTAQVFAISLDGASGTVADAPNGFILSDGVNTIFYKTEVIGEFKRGDNVIVNGATIEAASNMATGGNMSLVSEGTVAIDYATLVHDTVTTEEEVVAYAANHGLVSGSVLKVTGTFYISGTSGSSTEKWRARLVMDDRTGEKVAVYAWKDVATEAAISIHGHGNSLNFANWIEDFGFKFPSSGKGYAIVGTVTLVYSETTSSRYSSWTIIDYDITTPATYE